MWAACCNWLCLDRQTEEIAPRPHPGGRTQAYSNPGYNTHPNSMPSNCRGCGAGFENSARKHSCIDCGKNFCNLCSSQPIGGPRLCCLCLRFRTTTFVRVELMKMKVKDLRDYLSLHDVSTEMCREKEDLVELVLSQPHVPPAEPRTPSPLLNPGVLEENPLPTQTYPARRFARSVSSFTDAERLSNATTVHSQANGSIPDPAQPISGTENTAEGGTEDEVQSIDSEEILVPGRRSSLSDLASVDDIEALTVRQLKEILARNFVNYKGCCEKWELMERVTRLYNEQQDLRQQSEVVLPGSEDPLCKICMDSPIDCVLLECGHMVTCTKCGKRMSECPICRQYVVRAVHVFRS
ncbi:E3 ubiquitin-protein ligase rififylin isoform X3 [Ambystoma mexicanum]